MDLAGKLGVLGGNCGIFVAVETSRANAPVHVSQVHGFALSWLWRTALHDDVS